MRARRASFVVFVAAAALGACNALFDIGEGRYVAGAPVTGGGEGDARPPGDGGSNGDGPSTAPEPVLVASDVATDAATPPYLAVGPTHVFLYTPYRMDRIALSGPPDPTIFMYGSSSTQTTIESVAVGATDVYFVIRYQPGSSTRLHACPLTGCPGVSTPGTPVYQTSHLISATARHGNEVYWAEGGDAGGVLTLPSTSLTSGESTSSISISGDTLLSSATLASGQNLVSTLDLVSKARSWIADAGQAVPRVAIGGDRIAYLVYGDGAQIHLALSDGGEPTALAPLAGVVVRTIAIARGRLYWVTTTGVFDVCTISPSTCDSPDTVTTKSVVDFGINDTHVVWLQADGRLYEQSLD